MAAAHWLKSMILSAAAAAVVVPGAQALAQREPSPAAAAAAAVGPDAVQRDLEFQEQILRDPKSSPQQREEAARKLVSRDAEQALLRLLIDGGSRDVQLAVARALALDATPNPNFVEPLSQLLGQDNLLTEAAANALVTFKNVGAVRDLLARFIANQNINNNSRRAVVKAMGKLVDQDAAVTLIRLLNAPNENSLVRDAAAGALEQMTGLSYGTDPQRWNQWWDRARLLTPAQWAVEYAQRTSGQLDNREARLQAMRESLYRTEAAKYRQRFETDRPGAVADLLRMMSDPSEDVRDVAVWIVYDEAGLRVPPPQITEKLRTMVGDSSPLVRERVALTLGAVNDQAAVDALLTQAAQERNPDVLSAIISALGPASQLRGDFQTVEALLLASLEHESYAVSRSAAESLKALAGALRDPKNKAAADHVARRLHDRLRTTDRNVAALKLRESIVESLAELGHSSSREVFLQLLNPGSESPYVRIWALRGLRNIGNPDTAQAIVTVLNNDPDKGVRLQAAEALLTTARYANIHAIYPRLSERVEPDPTVQSRVWDVMSRLFELAEPRELEHWVEEFRKPPAEVNLPRRLVVLTVLEKKLAEGGKEMEEPLAVQRQNLGETLLKLGKAEDASIKFLQALDYWNNRKAPEFVTHQLVIQTMTALLQAKKDAQAVEFAKQAITANPAREGDLWKAMKDEIDSRQKKGDVEGAGSLAQQARNVPWIALRTTLLDAIEKELKSNAPAGSTSRIVHEPRIYEHVALQVHNG